MLNEKYPELVEAGFQPLHRMGRLGYLGKLHAGICVIIGPTKEDRMKLIRIRDSEGNTLYDAESRVEDIFNSVSEVRGFFAETEGNKRWSGLSRATRNRLFAIALASEGKDAFNLEDSTWEHIHKTYSGKLRDKALLEYDIATAARVAHNPIGYIFGSSEDLAH